MFKCMIFASRFWHYMSMQYRLLHKLKGDKWFVEATALWGNRHTLFFSAFLYLMWLLLQLFVPIYLKDKLLINAFPFFKLLSTHEVEF